MFLNSDVNDIEKELGLVGGKVGGRARFLLCKRGTNFGKLMHTKHYQSYEVCEIIFEISIYF